MSTNETSNGEITFLEIHQIPPSASTAESQDFQAETDSVNATGMGDEDQDEDDSSEQDGDPEGGDYDPEDGDQYSSAEELYGTDDPESAAESARDDLMKLMEN